MAPGVLHARMAGAIQPEHIRPLIEASDAMIQRGYRVLLAIDADDVHGYKTEVRKIMQLWMRQNRGDIEKVWVLFRSPLIKMGISMVNAFTGGMIRAFSDPEEFDAEIARMVERAHQGYFQKQVQASVRPM